MGKTKLTQFDFSMGELAPAFYGRPDISQYYKGCSLMENFYPLPGGGADKMPGTVYAGAVKTASKTTRLIRFIRSEEESYVIEVGHEYLRFWTSGEQVESGGSPYEITTPYQEADLFELKYVKIGESLYIVHSNYAPYELAYSSATSWTFTTITFTGVTFSASGDYPAAIGFFEQRLILANTGNNPQWIWMSQTADYTNFSVSSPVVDSDAVILDLNGQRNYHILWIEAATEIMLGCYGGEIVISGNENPITPTNFQIRYQSGYGCSSIQGKLFNESILFLQRHSNILRDYYYQADEESYLSPEVTFYSRHILAEKAVDIAIMSDPYQVYWVVLGNGEIAGISYNKAMQLKGAFRLKTEGYFESITVIPGELQDEIWAVVRHEINGSTVRYLEYFKPYEFGNQEDAFYVHCGKTFHNEGDITGALQTDPVEITSAAHGLSDGDKVYITGVGGMTELNDRSFIVANSTTDTFELTDEDGTTHGAYTSGGIWEQQRRILTGLDHLEGEDVAVSPDGGAIGSKTVDSGQIDIGRYSRKIHVGLLYTGKIKTMRLEADSDTILSKRRIAQIGMRFLRTLGCKVGPSEDDLQKIIFREASAPYGQPPELFSGDKIVDIPGNWDSDGYVYIVHDEPLPCTVQAMIFETNISGG